MKLPVLPSLCGRGMVSSSSWRPLRSFGIPQLARPSPVGHSPRGWDRRSAFSTQTRLGMENTLEAELDWDDRIGLQDRYTLEEKGWEVRVDWRSTRYGASLFAREDIAKGTILRRGFLGVNLKEFASIADIEDFCAAGSGGSDSPAYTAKLGYVKDYLWGFHRDADDRGYPSAGDEGEQDARFFGMWVPGNGLNHNETPNTVYKPTDRGIDLVALVDIAADDELFDDYRRHGASSPWLKEFSRVHNVTLNFADCNDFV